MARIDYYFSVLSPFTYLAGLDLEEIAARHGASIAYKPADIQKVFAETGGVPVPKRSPARQAYRIQELKRISARRRLPLNLQPAHWPTNPVPASTAIIAVAESGGDAGRLAHACLRAVWAEERDIGDPATVAAILAENGHDAVELAPAMAAAESTYQKNTEDAVAAGVFGAPSYVVGEEIFWGQDRLDYLDEYLGKAG
jgi:2-hydroxychromene-2-carboxylate isomerase